MTSEQVLNASYKRAFHTQRLLAQMLPASFFFFVRYPSKLVFYIRGGKRGKVNFHNLMEIPRFLLANLILIFNLGKDRTAENKKSLFEKLTKKQTNKKIYSSRCDLGASKECEVLSEHSSHSDYWHRCYYIFFYFSSVFFNK